MTLKVLKGTTISNEDRDVLSAAGIGIEEFAPEKVQPIFTPTPDSDGIEITIEGMD